MLYLDITIFLAITSIDRTQTATARFLNSFTQDRDDRSIMELIKTFPLLLPFLAFSGSCIALRRRGQDWRASFLVSATLCGVWVAVTTSC